MVEHDGVAVDAEVAGEQHDPPAFAAGTGVRAVDREVEAEVRLVVDLAAPAWTYVRWSAKDDITFALRSGRNGSFHRKRGAERSASATSSAAFFWRSSRLICEVVLDEVSAVGQRRRLRHDLGDDPREELVLQLDPVLRRRAREEAVDERDLRRVAGRVAPPRAGACASSAWSHGTPKSAKRSPLVAPGSGAPGKNHEPARTPSRVAVSETR